MSDVTEFDVLIVGSGAAGLGLALELPSDVRVGVLTKGAISDSNTYFAQGGIAAVLDETDTTDSHVNDTLIAGGGICDEQAVRFIVENGRDAIEKLVSLGVDFSQEEHPDGQTAPHLTREGGHSHRRVVHVADATGREVEMTLIERVNERANVTMLEHHMAVDLIRETDSDGRRGRCIGAYALDVERDSVLAYGAKATVLATGGACKVYLYTSNPDGATGDGIAIAWRAGCRVANLEFTQFHPTCLYHPEAKSFLITEAVRGEGGKLLLPDGSRFMDGFHEMAELAPRDVVARAIDHEMKRLGVESVFLDISHKSADFILEHFPTVHEKCLEYGIDITKDPIPVVPAAHYTCGGVVTDLAGRTDIDGLYAAGEVAHTGLHGANRMASNSLLECLVISSAVAEDLSTKLGDTPDPSAIRQWDASRVRDSDEDVVVSHNWDELRRFMWDYVGIVRTTKRLERAKHRVDLLRSEISEYYGNYRVTGDLLELRNLTVVADLIIRSAMMRTESRGLHYTLDHPEPDTSRVPQNTLLVPPQR
jgi:L-aspartate oxidase